MKGRVDLLLSGDARWTSVSSGRRVGVTVIASPIGSCGIFGEWTSGQDLETPIQYSAARWAWLSFFDYKPAENSGGRPPDSYRKIPVFRKGRICDPAVDIVKPLTRAVSRGPR